MLSVAHLLDTNILIAALLGIAASVCLHLSQGLMRLGLTKLTSQTKKGAGFIYAAGLLLNFSAPFWVMVANLYAPTFWFTSMFATGLIALLLFSHVYLDDKLTLRKNLGALGIILATLLLAFGILGTLPKSNIELELLLLCSLIWLISTPLIAFLIKNRTLQVQEVFFGIAAGGFFAFDALWKSQAQTSINGSITFLPEQPIGWALLAASFAGAAGAFLMMQWSYLRHCRASAVVSGYNLAYTLLPILIIIYVTGAQALSLKLAAAIALLFASAYLLQQPSNVKHTAS